MASQEYMNVVFQILPVNPDADASRIIHFEEGISIRVGRPGNAVEQESVDNLIFGTLRLSRSHALIKLDDGQLFIQDTGSKLGTFINGRRLSSSGAHSEWMAIQHQDVLKFGDSIELESLSMPDITLKVYLNSTSIRNVTNSYLYEVPNFSGSPKILDFRLPEIDQLGIERVENTIKESDSDFDEKKESELEGEEEGGVEKWKREFDLMWQKLIDPFPEILKMTLSQVLAEKNDEY